MIIWTTSWAVKKPLFSSSRCLSIDSSSSKCWSPLTYPILNQSFAGSVDFLLSFEENADRSASRAPKNLRRCSSKWNNVPWLVPSLRRRWFRCWRPETFENADFIYYEMLKPNETITGERYPTQLTRLSQALRKKRPQYEHWHEKVILQHENARPHVAKHTCKRSNSKFYPTRRIPQILRRPIITYSGRWHMVWLISSSAHMKTSKNGLIRG